jgi:predicted ribosome quality control (RQC) complex YloA/Tae2 family protein
MFDGLVMAAVAAEFRQELIGARVDKIYQPSGLEIVITMRQPGKNVTVLASAKPEAARVHITQVERKNPSHPPPFCMLLRKYLMSSRVTEVAQVGLDRILRVTFSRSREEVPKTLVIEVMGRHSNIALIDGGSNMILDSIKHIGADVSRVRQMGPGIQYMPPPSQDKLNILLLSKEELSEILSKFQEMSPDASCSRFLISSFAGLGHDAAAKILSDAGIVQDLPCTFIHGASADRLFDTLLELSEAIRKERFLPHPSQLLDSEHSLKEDEDGLFGERAGLLNVVCSNIARCKRKREAQDDEISQANKDLECRKLGELILANAPEISPGTKTVEILDYFDPSGEKIEVCLDPMLSAPENAQRYFTTYARAKRVLENTVKQAKMTRAELEYLEQVSVTLQQADSLREIEAIRIELMEQGYLQDVAENRIRRKESKTPGEVTLLSFIAEGHTIIVGRNNKENDFITMKIAGPDDVWMHARRIPGAHVVIKAGQVKGEVSEAALLAGAGIAAYFSKGRTDSKVAVDYTLRRHIKKPKGARPGMVTYDHQRTIMAAPVLPDHDIMQ